MQNVTPFPIKTTIIKQKVKKEKPKQQQSFSYIKMTLAVVVGNVIAVAGLFVMFLIFLNMTSSMID